MSISSRAVQYGEVLDGWRIQEFLGSGSGGKTGVFRIVKAIFGSEELCALKVVNVIEEEGCYESLSEERKAEYKRETQKRYLAARREVELMSKLRGNAPNVVTYLGHDCCFWQDKSRFGHDLLIRMELLDCLTNHSEEWKEEDIIQIGKDICAALVECHRQNILHRDIKPGNIFVKADDDCFHYLLGDFGISRIVDKSQRANTRTCTSQFAAPEQLKGAGYDRRVDIYSLGLTLYMLCNKNRLPFAENQYSAPDSPEVIRRLRGEPLPAPSNASPGLAQVILKACAYDPDKRYQNAHAFLDALGALAQDAAKVNFAAGEEKTAEEQEPAQREERRNDPYVTLPANSEKQLKQHLESAPVGDHGIGQGGDINKAEQRPLGEGGKKGSRVRAWFSGRSSKSKAKPPAKLSSNQGNLKYDGITLMQYMQKKGVPLGWKEALYLITNAAQELKDAHRQGIIHKNINPYNIVVLRDGSVNMINYSTDGAARAAGFGSAPETACSKYYQAPERIENNRADADGRSDVYSVGVVLYEMLTGKLPYEGDTIAVMASQFINSPPALPRALNPEVPEALEFIAMKAIAHDPMSRYASASEMLADLEEFRSNPEVRFAPSGGGGCCVQTPAARYYILRIRTNEEIELTQFPFLVGTGLGSVSYYVSGNSAVSRRHAEFSLQGGECVISDQKSTNKTYVNDRALAPFAAQSLRDGDTIRLGDEKFKFIQRPQ